MTFTIFASEVSQSYRSESLLRGLVIKKMNDAYSRQMGIKFSMENVFANLLGTPPESVYFKVEVPEPSPASLYNPNDIKGLLK